MNLARNYATKHNRAAMMAAIAAAARAPKRDLTSGSREAPEEIVHQQGYGDRVGPLIDCAGTVDDSSSL